MGNTAVSKLGSGHGGTVSTGEVTNVANWLDSWAPAPPPVVDRTGQVVYDDNCAGCHKLYGYDTAGNIDLASMGNTAITKLGTGHGGTVSAGEVTNIANWLDSWAPAPPPVVTRNGETVYNDNCSGCHKVNSYDANGNIDLAGQGNLVPNKLATGHGGTVTADEQTNLVNWLNTFQASDPYAGACDSCHGQPPSGNTFPNTVGAHDVHTALNGLTSNCAACHSDAAHNDQIDRGIATVWSAKSGTATRQQQQHLLEHQLSWRRKPHRSGMVAQSMSTPSAAPATATVRANTTATIRASTASMSVAKDTPARHATMSTSSEMVISPTWRPGPLSRRLRQPSRVR